MADLNLADSGLTAGGVNSALAAVGHNHKLVTYPDGFTFPLTGGKWDNFQVYKNGKEFACNITPQDIIDTTAISKVYRVDIEKGDDANSGSTWANSVKSIWRAIELAMSSNLDCKIFIKGGIYPIGNGFLNNDASVDLENRTIIFEGVYGRPLIGAFSFNTWTLSSGQTNTYECTRAGAIIALNPTILHSATAKAKGGYLQYKNVTSIAEVEAEAGTFWVDGSTCYAHPHNSEVASDLNVRIMESKKMLSATNIGNLMFNNLDTEGGRLGFIYSAVTGENSGAIVTQNTSHRYTISGSFDTPDPWSTFSLSDVAVKAFFNTDASFNSADGFSVSGSTGANNCGLFTVNCTSSFNGLLTQHASTSDKPTSVNGFTGHNGLSSISVGGEYIGSTGTNVAFVHENTLGWCIGTTFGASEGDTINGKAIVCGGASVSDAGAKLWLDSCTGISCDRELQSSSGGEMLLRDHVGCGYRQASTGTIVNY